MFLYSLYVNQHAETLNVQIQGNISIEDSLRLDNITYGDLPVSNENPYYVSAEIAAFTNEQIATLENQSVKVTDEIHLTSTIAKPVKVLNSNGNYNFNEFISKYVLNGTEYTLWEMDEKNQRALFFQRVNDNPIYYNQNAMLTLYWNDSGEVISYEQRMFGEFVSYNRKKDLLPPLQAINILNNRNYLKPDSKVLSVEYGYSTLFQVTKTQVFAPTWHIHVELSDGEIEDYFINAIEGKIIEFQSEPLEYDEE